MVYVRILVAAGLSIALALIFGRDYCGAGFNLVEKAVDGESAYLGFLLKMIFTAVALGGGFKGGELFQHWRVGASFGCTFGLLTGFEPSLCAAAGMLATFVGVTNCPIATMFLGFELFGFEARRTLRWRSPSLYAVGILWSLQRTEVYILQDEGGVY